MSAVLMTGVPMWLVHLGAALPLVLLAGLAPPAQANWQHQRVQQLQQTTYSASQEATFTRTSLDVVAATGIRASAPLIEQGQWNPATTYSPSQPGGVFTLQLTREAADSEPPASLSALDAPASGRSASVAPLVLEASVLPDGSLRAGPGSAASEVRLTLTETYSVFRSSSPSF